MMVYVQIGLFVVLAFVCMASSLNTYSGKKLF